ncbi:hypothetical protein GDO86_000458 [Hymenochirus boettgeri]|uniref:Histone PARylation factor 1 n=1 Tax=Hymenochirus boettgeri TaxID=247094 RepID=A0A8T2K8L5_9PIPI|nr:hypothetical protein GDO86_000458 [Hymenochirus boettgeri]
MTSRKSRSGGAVMAGGGKRKSKAAQQCEENMNDVKRRQLGQSSISNDFREEVKSMYNLTMPEDFYHFWGFCAEMNPNSPSDALKSSLGLQLVGPYDILCGKHKCTKKETEINYHLHWRFFYDPPEFQTILVEDSKTQFHLGYFRDSPEELPVFVGSNEAAKGCLINQLGDNVFSAVKQCATKKLKEVTDKKISSTIKDLIEKLTAAAKDLGYSLEQKSAIMKKRNKKVVTKSFHSAGLVVPVDKNNVGYRELPETDGDLKRICKAIVDASDDDKRMKAFAPIQEIFTYVQFANDECDYGMGYELGIDLFCYGSHYFHKMSRQLLSLAYKLLERNLFAEIIESHLSNRNRENISQL